MNSMLTELTSRYDAYVDTFRAADGSLPAMMQLKREHTERVVANAREIAAGEYFDGSTREAALIAALLHDTGRYEQLRRYNTFRDSESVDHAVFSHDLVVEQGWLKSAAGMQPEMAASILAAVLYHNRRELPAGLEPLTSACARTVRDADKLDIFRVLEERVKTTDWRHDTQAFWNLQTDAPPNPEVLAAIEARQPVDYQAIRSLADFVLIQVGWMISGLEYATSRQLCRERGHLAFRREFLQLLTDDPAVDRICNLVG